MEILLLSLVGWAVVGGLIYEATDDDDDDDNGGGNRPPADEGQVIAIPEGETGEGGEGDDTITGGYTAGASGNGGDDTIWLEGLDSLASGGAGDDLVRVDYGYNSTIWGGNGDDTLIGGRGDRMTFSGGPGDDSFELDLQRTYIEGFHANGGPGDDTFDLQVAYGASAGFPAPGINGGQGADQFNVTLAPIHFPTTQDEEEDASGSNVLLGISGFTPGLDHLTIDLSAADLDSLTGLRIEDSASGNDGSVTLSFERLLADGRLATIEAVISVAGGAGLTQSDITLTATGVTDGNLISVADPAETVGTEGADTIIGHEAATVLGTGGDDVIRIGAAGNGTISGGDGDDLIVVPHVANGRIEGDAGDDTIRGGHGGRVDIFGGSGDDLLELDYSSGMDEYTRADGGEGDDILAIGLGWNDSIHDITPQVTGGAGADSFIVALGTLESHYDPEDSEFTATADLLTITDFTPGEDALQITPPAGGAEYTGARLVEADGSTVVILDFLSPLADGTFQTLHGRITLAGVTGLDPDDLVILPVAA